MDKSKYDNVARWQLEDIDRKYKRDYDSLHTGYILSVQEMLFERWQEIGRLESKLRERLAQKNAPKLIKVDHGMVLFA